MRCVTRSAVLLKRHVFGVQIIHFKLNEVNYHRHIELEFDSDGLANVVPKQIWNQNSHHTVTRL